MGRFEEIKMAVNPIIKLPQTKAMVFLKKWRKERERGGNKRERKLGRPPDLK